MDPTGTGTKFLPFTRSATVRSTDGLNTRETVNSITHFIDASMVRWRLPALKGNGTCVPPLSVRLW
jgi:hypothetical protein